MNDLQLTHNDLKLEDVYRKAVSDDCGATSLFVGTTRNNNENRIVSRLEEVLHPTHYPIFNFIPTSFLGFTLNLRIV